MTQQHKRYFLVYDHNCSSRGELGDTSESPVQLRIAIGTPRDFVMATLRELLAYIEGDYVSASQCWIEGMEVNAEIERRLKADATDALRAEVARAVG